MEQKDVPKAVRDLAKSIVHTRIHDYPEDEWVQVGYHFDLNMFIQDDGEFRYQVASLYRIVDGNTDTSDFLQIWHQHIVDEEYKQFQLEQDAKTEAEWLASREQLGDLPNEDDEVNQLFDSWDPFDDYDYEPIGLTYSRLDPTGVYTPDGRKIGSTCNCEDYPCCGH